MEIQQKDLIFILSLIKIDHIVKMKIFNSINSVTNINKDFQLNTKQALAIFL
jgi:hypothetical protein